MLAQIVGSLGGVWFADSEVPSGTIESGHVYTSRPVNFTVFDSHQINDLGRLIGAEPMSYIELGLGKDEGPTNLGYDVARQMIERWEGVAEEGDSSFRRLSH